MEPTTPPMTVGVDGVELEPESFPEPEEAVDVAAGAPCDPAGPNTPPTAVGSAPSEVDAEDNEVECETVELIVNEDVDEREVDEMELDVEFKNASGKLVDLEIDVSGNHH